MKENITLNGFNIQIHDWMPKDEIMILPNIEPPIWMRKIQDLEERIQAYSQWLIENGATIIKIDNKEGTTI